MRRYYHFVNDVITDGHVELGRVPSEEMHADFLTKNLSQAQLNHHLTALGLISGEFPPIYPMGGCYFYGLHLWEG